MFVALRLIQGSQTHLGVRATLQDISHPVGRTVFRDDKMQKLLQICDKICILSLLLSSLISDRFLDNDDSK